MSSQLTTFVDRLFDQFHVVNAHCHYQVQSVISTYHFCLQLEAFFNCQDDICTSVIDAPTEKLRLKIIIIIIIITTIIVIIIVKLNKMITKMFSSRKVKMTINKIQT